MPKMIELIGQYCPDCIKSLIDFQLSKYAIVAMCREDLSKFLRNGDIDRVAKLIEEKEKPNAT